ncbi:MAG: S41 family peptidase [Patescibacteria group bacterium]
MKSEKLRLLFVALIAGLIGYSLGTTKIDMAWKGFSPHVEVAGKEPPPSAIDADFSQMWTVLEKLEGTYYDKKAIDPQKLVNGAIEGMVASLDDPYTVYLPPKQNTDFKDGMAGKFEGIGAELGTKEKQVIIVAPLDGSPAQKAGLKSGDIIAKVNEDYITGWSINKVVDKIRGPKGTEVLLTVVRSGEQEPKEVKITRDTITVKSLTSWIKPVKEVEKIQAKSETLKNAADQQLAYIRLSQFGDSTNAEWSQVAADIDRKLQADPNIKGVVFDLRNNPGGYLGDAVYIASEFVSDGTAVMQEDKNAEQTKFPVSGNGLLTDVPIVVLINKGSASASEIVAGALRDHNRALLVGETSFGKGTIQQAEDLGGGSGLHVTIAKWLTPEGIWVHKNGLKPDVEVAVDKENPEHDAQLEKAIETLLDGEN